MVSGDYERIELMHQRFGGGCFLLCGRCLKQRAREEGSWMERFFAVSCCDHGGISGIDANDFQVFFLAAPERKVHSPPKQGQGSFSMIFTSVCLAWEKMHTDLIEIRINLGSMRARNGVIHRHVELHQMYPERESSKAPPEKWRYRISTRSFLLEYGRTWPLLAVSREQVPKRKHIYSVNLYEYRAYQPRI
jgi:hypothetical protein